jgi:hypothetical protein
MTLTLSLTYAAPVSSALFLGDDAAKMKVYADRTN